MRIYIIGNDGITLCREPPPTIDTPPAPAHTPAENRGFSTWDSEFPRETGSHLTLRWRETDSNHRYRA